MAAEQARQEIAPGLWSIAVPGTLKGTMVRVALQASPPPPPGAGLRAVRPVIGIVTVEVHTMRGAVEAVEIPIRELRALLAVIGEWPGVQS